MLKQLALIFSDIEDPQTSLVELRELKDNVERLLVDRSESDEYLHKLLPAYDQTGRRGSSRPIAIKGSITNPPTEPHGFVGTFSITSAARLP